MPEITCFRDVVELWSTPESMGADIGATKEAARKWGERNRIPSTWWWAISESKVGRKNRVSFEVLGRFERERAWEKEAAA